MTTLLSTIQNVTGSGNYVTVTGDINVSIPRPSPETFLLRELMDKVESYWINDQLDAWVPDRFILIEKATLPDNVDHPVLGGQARPQRVDDVSTSIDTLYNECGKALLILGQPGCGKTVSMLNLARALIQRARASEQVSEPIPVVLPLSTWTRSQADFLSWVGEQFSSLYHVSKKKALDLLDSRRLVLLLDGLDEVRPSERAACIQAINDFCVDPGVPGLVVCCRDQEYEELIAEASQNRLKLNQAILLRPLDSDYIDAYLDSIGQGVAGLRQLLQEDQELKQLSQTPLMLNLMVEAYRDKGHAELVDKTSSLADRKQYLFESYVRRMYEHKPTKQAPYPKSLTRRWLRWLAQQSSRHHQTVFLIEQLQPSWLGLGNWGQVWYYLLVSRGLAGLVFGLVIGLTECLTHELAFQLSLDRLVAGLVLGLIVGMTFAVIDMVRLRTASRSDPLGTSVWPIIVAFVVYGVLWGGVISVPTLLFTDPGEYDATEPVGWGILGGLVFGLRSKCLGLSSDIHTTERLSWSWRGVIKGIGKGIVVGVVGSAFLLMVYLFLHRDDLALSFESVKFPWLFVLSVLLLFGLLGALIGLVIGGLKRREIEHKILPNQGITSTLINLGWITFLTFLGGAFLGAGSLALISKSAIGPSVICGLVFCLIFGLIYGGMDVIRHYALRCLLAASSTVPYDLGRFLDHARKLRFLKKVGPGYAFMHNFFREQFAAAPLDAHDGEYGHEDGI